jgi:hypothetical protein
LWVCGARHAVVCGGLPGLRRAFLVLLCPSSSLLPFARHASPRHAAAPRRSASSSHAAFCRPPLPLRRVPARPWLPRPASTLGPALWALPDPVAHVASNRRPHLGVQTSYKSPFTAHSPLSQESLVRGLNHPAPIPSASSAWPAPRAVAPLSPCISCPFCARLAAPSQPCPCTSTTSNCYTRK